MVTKSVLHEGKAYQKTLFSHDKAMKYNTLINAKQLISNNNLRQYSIVTVKWTAYKKLVFVAAEITNYK